MSINKIVDTFFFRFDSMFRMFKTNRILKFIFPKYIWKLPNSEKKIYLSFDDGPIPDVTEWVIELLKKENIKATFFCIGDNIIKHPTVFQKIISEKHSIGNHTFNHLNGWKTSTKEYVQNVKKWEKEINHANLASKLFRPPYGKIKNVQAREIQKLGYKIIMWDVLSYDFDKNVTPKVCLKNTLKNISNGSIIVFHDSIKANKNLKKVLPELIQLLKKEGYIFDKIT